MRVRILVKLRIAGFSRDKDVVRVERVTNQEFLTVRRVQDILDPPRPVIQPQVVIRVVPLDSLRRELVLFHDYWLAPFRPARRA